MIALDQLPAAVRQAFEALQAENERQANTLLIQDQELRRQAQVIQIQNEKIHLLNLRLWGPKGETFSPAQTAMLFDEASVTAAEVRQEAQRPDAATASPLPRAKKTRGQHPGREPLPAHLERREITLHCHPDDCRCRQCGAQRPVICYETREELGCEPAKFFVKVIKREKRGSHCLPEQGVATAPVPPRACLALSPLTRFAGTPTHARQRHARRAGRAAFARGGIGSFGSEGSVPIQRFK